jgi:hypothetical protein
MVSLPIFAWVQVGGSVMGLARVIVWSEWGQLLEFLGGLIFLWMLVVIVVRFSLAARGRISLGKQDMQYINGLYLSTLTASVGYLITYYAE